MKNLLLMAILALSLSACVSTDYKFGDVSKGYCASTTPEGRVILKQQLNAIGIKPEADYCTSVGLIDAMAKLVKTIPAN